ncbi:hypothetical protein VSDG_00941 [Cytospora chrysosperma]|uniref:Glucose-methanol-choline oxidoreductase N-terminal domain-containing protein n=1 Tax=Cytospora chrysosperma TaxID=252740 RepID=A0A423WL33_CYTCH|nr:hypothetical protein VSDG_00941 [Valsa sordida]
MKNLISLSLAATAVAARPGPGLGRKAGVTEYDYIVVGGGTSGLVVASRLSEEPSVSVLVIEAGETVLENTNVTDANGYGLAFGTEIDYAYKTTPQAYANNASTTMRAAKALGGTSTINGMAYTRAEASQIDAWETLGNEGWNWSTLFPYYLKSETFQVPDAARLDAAHEAYNLEYHGTDGPLYTSFVYGDTNDSYPISMNETYQALGLPWSEDTAGGSMVGFTSYPKTINQDLNIRWDAARAYYYPYQNRTNLKVMLSTTARKLTWASTEGTEATASGVEITTADGTTSVVNARKEVILSAGALVSPLLLELSGVGNPTILSQYGIETVVELPTVGENLQDQINNELVYQPPSNFTAAYDGGSAQFVAYPAASHVFGTNESTISGDLQAQLSAYADAVAIANGNVTKASDLLEFFQMQYDLIFKDEIPYAEILIYISSGTWGAEYWGLLPFSRGSVHISQANSTTDAVINPNYFMLDYDVELQVATAKFIRDVFATEPFASIAGTETTPGFDAVSADADQATWKSWAVSKYRSNFHPVATAAMMPKEKGGVVDSDLKVYGTTNVRVVDASVLPMQVCGHLVSTLYAVAEKAADSIKACA